VLVGQGATVFYFLFFVILIPAIGIFESKLWSFNGNNSLRLEKYF
jgi:hypothetical protein